MPLGFFVESAVAVLLAVTIGYCAVLNHKLSKLHADRAALRDMVGDLVNATDLANRAIHELKVNAQEAEATIGTRLEEAERFGIELANHINAGQAVLDRIMRITQAAKPGAAAGDAPQVAVERRAQSVLEQLRAHQKSRESAA